MNITHKGHLHHQKQLFAHYLKIKIVYPMEEQKDIKDFYLCCSNSQSCTPAIP